MSHPPLRIDKNYGQHLRGDNSEGPTFIFLQKKSSKHNPTTTYRFSSYPESGRSAEHSREHIIAQTGGRAMNKIIVRATANQGEHHGVMCVIASAQA